MCGAFGTFAHQAYTARLRGQLSSNVRHHKENLLDNDRENARLAAQKISKALSERSVGRTDEPQIVASPWELTGSPLPTPDECAVTFEFVCAQRWAELRETDDLDIRMCDSCGKEVHLCKTREQVESASRLRHCVSFQP